MVIKFSNVRSGIPIPRDSREERDQLQMAMRNSLASMSSSKLSTPRRRKPPPPPPSASLPAAQDHDRNRPIHTRLVKGTAPDDGNCFLHSLKAVAGHQLARVLQKPADRITPADIRHHVASTVISQLYQCLKSPMHEAAMLEKHPYLVSLSAWDPADGRMANMRNREHYQLFVDLLGPANAALCKRLTPEQQTNIYFMALDRSWSSACGDVMPQAAAAAFPGLRLRVVTPDVTPSNVDQYTFGEGRGRPCLLFLDNNHYVPALEGAQDR